jgi:hypothetical protein
VWIEYKIIINNLRKKFVFMLTLLLYYRILGWWLFLIGNLLVRNLNDRTEIFRLENKRSDKEYNDYKLFRVLKPPKDFYNLIEGILLYKFQSIPLICEPNKGAVEIIDKDGNYKISKYGG